MNRLLSLSKLRFLAGSSVAALIAALIAALTITVLSVSSVRAADERQIFKEIVAAAPQAGILLERDGKTLLSRHADRLYVPASLVKIPLALSAYELLGDAHRFVTDFYTDDRNNLLIHGRGDPFLVSEEWHLIARQIKLAGYSRFNELFLDTSLFRDLALPGGGNSQNPYDASFGSLFVNFNTMNLKLRQDGTVVSAEKQTPTLPVMQSYADKLLCCEKNERINVGKDPAAADRYTAELVRRIFRANGITFTDLSSLNSFKTGAVAKGNWRLMYRHKNSRTLAKILGDMLYYSTNIVANAILMQFATDRHRHRQSTPTLQDALNKWHTSLKRALRVIPEALGTGTSTELHLYEGAGLDRNNRMSARMMARLLRRFAPHKNLLRYYEPTEASYKTGTLDGVCNAAGFLKSGAIFALFTASCEERDRVIALLARADTRQYKRH